MELPRPEPGPGELLVRVRAAGVNPLDYKIRDGGVKVLLRFSFPLVLGTDLAGDVEALIEVAGLRAGQKILIHAGSGGVGTFAIQLAKHLGAQVATTASAKNRALLEALGADVVIDYKTSRFEVVLWSE